MARLFRDTRPEAEQILIELMRQAPPWRKMEMVGQMYRTVRQLMLVGLRERHPDASPDELRRRLADLLLGPELAKKVHGLLREGSSPMLTEPIAVTLLVIEALEQLDVPYLIGGSLASARYGAVRATMDADLVADLRLEHADPLAQALEGAFYVDTDAVRDAVRRRDSFNVIHLETVFKVDIFIPKGRPFDRAQFERREKKVMTTDPERTAYVASAEDIVLAKLEWYQMGGGVSKRQWEDIQSVLKAQGDRLDLAYMRRWAAELGVADLLARALADAEQA